MAQTMTGESALRQLLTPEECVQLDIAIDDMKRQGLLMQPESTGAWSWLFHAFEWGLTPQGATYWDDIYERVRQEA